MLIRKPNDIPPSEITTESAYWNRRSFMKATAAFVTTSIVGGFGVTSLACGKTQTQDGWRRKALGPYDTDEDLTPFEDITTYNNFYEFGVDKEDPHENAQDFKTAPWTISIEGEVRKPGRYNLEDFLKPYTMEDRIYRLRCVEGWSMVIPWLGFSMSEFIRRVEPTSRAKFVEFVTLHDPQQMPGQRSPYLNWPYREGLRMDEAMHPLAIICVGLYGKELPNQDGAPIRIVVPWKYGFKSAKSIVRIRFVEDQPGTAWQEAAPNEYGFYSNVNPEVDHPRWSQKFERRIGEFFKRKTLMFNGYADQVAHLYRGMDLKKYY